MTTITYNGKEEKAYNLLMRKENALDIIKGKKQVEIRAFSDAYVAMFVDQAIIDRNAQLDKDGRSDECECPMREDVWCIRFRNYNSTWYLDVSIGESGIGSLVEEEMQMLHDEFNFHDLDAEYEKHRDTPEDERPMFFWFKIDKVLSHNLKP